MATSHLRDQLQEVVERFLDFARVLWKSNLPRVLFFLILGLTCGGTAIMLTEGKRGGEFANFWNSVWWAIVSMTSTGYGDMSPTTASGRSSGRWSFFRV